MAKSSMSKFMRRVGFAFMLAVQAVQLNCMLCCVWLEAFRRLEAPKSRPPEEDC